MENLQLTQQSKKKKKKDDDRISKASLPMENLQLTPPSNKKKKDDSKVYNVSLLFLNAEVKEKFEAAITKDRLVPYKTDSHPFGIVEYAFYPAPRINRFKSLLEGIGEEVAEVKDLEQFKADLQDFLKTVNAKITTEGGSFDSLLGLVYASGNAEELGLNVFKKKREGDEIELEKADESELENAEESKLEKADEIELKKAEEIIFGASDEEERVSQEEKEQDKKDQDQLDSMKSAVLTMESVVMTLNSLAENPHAPHEIQNLLSEVKLVSSNCLEVSTKMKYFAEKLKRKQDIKKKLEKMLNECTEDEKKFMNSAKKKKH